MFVGVVTTGTDSAALARLHTMVRLTLLFIPGNVMLFVMSGAFAWNGLMSWKLRDRTTSRVYARAPR